LLLVASEYGKKESEGFVIDLPFSHEELSFLVGAHRVSITRAMKELRRTGRIIQNKKKITLIEGPN
jgi:CRP/FNR family transcriptional regulator